MSFTASDLLKALKQTGTPDSTIELGEKFNRLMNSDNCPHRMIEHFEGLKITEGTIHKAKDLVHGRKKIQDFLGAPPPKVQENEHLAKTIAAETARICGEIVARQLEKQAEANASSVGNPKAQKEQLAAAKR